MIPGALVAASPDVGERSLGPVLEPIDLVALGSSQAATVREYHPPVGSQPMAILVGSKPLPPSHCARSLKPELVMANLRAVALSREPFAIRSTGIAATL